MRMSAYRRFNRTSRSSVSISTFLDNLLSIISRSYVNYVLNQSTSTGCAGSNSSQNDLNTDMITVDTNASRLVNMDEASTQHVTVETDSNEETQSDMEKRSECDWNISNGFTAYPLQPKHIRFPDVPFNSELLNELMIFVYTTIGAAMQFLHLYRTVWWLPESNTNQTMVRNF